jgi:hypothetical protein
MAAVGHLLAAVVAEHTEAAPLVLAEQITSFNHQIGLLANLPLAEVAVVVLVFLLLERLVEILLEILYLAMVVLVVLAVAEAVAVGLVTVQPLQELAATAVLVHF